MDTAAFFATVAFVFLVDKVTSGWAQAAVRIPSTLLHELAHYLLAHVTGSRPTPIDLVPRRDGAEWVLGSVVFHPKPLTAAFVALAPLLLLVPAWQIWQSLGAEPWDELVVKGLLFGWCLKGSPPSSADWVVAAKYPLGLALTALVGYSCLYVLQGS